jgi:hypothetical protein
VLAITSQTPDTSMEYLINLVFDSAAGGGIIFYVVNIGINQDHPASLPSINFFGISRLTPSGLWRQSRWTPQVRVATRDGVDLSATLQRSEETSSHLLMTPSLC